MKINKEHKEVEIFFSDLDWKIQLPIVIDWVGIIIVGLIIIAGIFF